MPIEKEWEISKPLYLVSARAEWYEEKARGAWAEKTGGCIIQQEKHVRWCVEQLHVSSMLPSHLTDTISVHTVVTEAVTSLTLRNSAYSKRLVWKGTQRTETLWSGQHDRDGAVSSLESRNTDTLIVFLI